VSKLRKEAKMDQHKRWKLILQRPQNISPMNPVQHTQIGAQYTHKGFKLLKKQKNQNPFNHSQEMSKSNSTDDL
jgi:hypothetical protein